MTSLPPTSPITPKKSIDDEEIIELYEQDNMSKSSLTMQQELEQVGKVGLYLVEEIKAKNQLIEDLAGRLRMIYSSPNTPDLSLPVDSFISSIRPASSRTMSPLLPPGVLNECMERAEKEIARLEEQLLVQTREIEVLQQDLAAATDQISTEREKFKDDRVKLKKEIMELQVVIKRKDQFASNALVKAKDRLTATSASTQVTGGDLTDSELVIQDLQKKTNEMERMLTEKERERKEIEAFMNEERRRNVELERRIEGQRHTVQELEKVVNVEKFNQHIQADFGDLSELQGLRETLDGLLNREFLVCETQTEETVNACTSTQTAIEWTDLIADTEEKALVFSRAIEEEREVYSRQLEDLQSELERMKKLHVESREIGVWTEQTRVSNHGCNTESVSVFSLGIGDDLPRRFMEESAQTAGSDEITALTEENQKLREKYLKYRSEYASVVEKRKSALPVGTSTDKAPMSSMSTGTEDAFRAVDRGTTITPQIVSDSIVQVDDDRDAKLFLVESDLAMLMEDRDALISERDRLARELEKLSQKSTKSETVRAVLSTVHTERVHGDATPTLDVSLGGATFDQSDIGTLTDLADPHEVGVLQEIGRITDRTVDQEIGTITDRTVDQEIGTLTDRTVDQEMGTLTDRTVDQQVRTFTEEVGRPEAILQDVSDLSPVSLSVRLNEYLDRPGTSEHQLIRSLQKRLLASEKSLKEKNEFFKFELDKMRQQLQRPPVQDIASNTDKERVVVHTADTGCNTDRSTNPLSPSLPKLLDGSPRHPKASLDVRDMVSYYQLGSEGKKPEVSEIDLSGISKPLLTTSCSPLEGATSFDFSITQQDAVSSLSPLRIPFATPVAKDRDGDVVMKSAPRTQIRNSEFPVHLDVVQEELPSSVFESAAGDNNFSQSVQEMKTRLKSVRAKAILIGNLTNRLWTMTSISNN